VQTFRKADLPHHHASRADLLGQQYRLWSADLNGGFGRIEFLEATIDPTHEDHQRLCD
jgi:hypothetical protein